MPYTLTVRDHLMIAHSFSGEMFGPAQRLHGATFIVDASFGADDLDSNGVVVDIGAASAALAQIVATLTYRNLDDHPDFAGVNTTTEVLCRAIADRLADACARGELSADAVTSLSVTLHESHIAWASYTRTL